MTDPNDNLITPETIQVLVGAEFIVRLKSTPTTGYFWEVQTSPEGVQLLGSDTEKPVTAIQPGDPVTQVFRFRAQKAGEHIITFVLKRRWESSPIESHVATVKANDAPTSRNC